jgi:hypothetical protein
MRDDPIQQPLCHIQKLSDDQLKAIQDAVYVGMTPKVSCWKHGGASRDRTDDLIVANDAILRTLPVIPQQGRKLPPHAGIAAGSTR